MYVILVARNLVCLVLGGLITASTASVTVTVTQRLDTPSARLRVWRMVVIQNSVQLAICCAVPTDVRKNWQIVV